MPAPGRFWGTCMVEQVLPIADAFNLTCTKVMENRDYHAHPRVLIPTEADLDGQMLTDQPGEYIYYNSRNGRVKPEGLYAPGVSSDVWRFLELEQRLFQSISGATAID